MEGISISPAMVHPRNGAAGFLAGCGSVLLTQPQEQKVQQGSFLWDPLYKKLEESTLTFKGTF